ncbi:MAG: secretin N-terminal domain-containing protein [Caulobacteraceae bacterium]|nr:secretin N-terminal domain-containing protein [Caulobacteraceae bacterium]
MAVTLATWLRRGMGGLRPLAPTLAVLVLAILFGSGDRAWAQIQPPPPPAVLTDISATDAGAGAGATQVLLTFAPQAPRFSVIGDGTARPSIAFALSSRGSSARLAAGAHGLLRGVDFEQSDTVLILHLAAASRARLVATPVGGRTISLTLTPDQTTHAAGPGGPAGPLPRAAVRDPDQDGFEVVPLKYADVSEVVGLLTEGLTVKSNDTFVPHEPAFGSAGMNGGANFAPAAPAANDVDNEPLAQSVDDTIAVDRRLNAIILKGPPDVIARLKQKIAQIDVPVQSVLLETVFVELDESGAKNVGLDFNNTSSQIGVATFQTGAYIPSGEPLSSSLTSVSLQAALYAQVRTGHGRIVSKPRIAAQSGSTAKIITGDALPILTSIALSGVNAVSQQVQYVNVGVTLQIAPRVSSDGFVTSHVFCVVSSETGTSQGYPTISQREAETSATVRDGETFVIGGLTEESESTSNSRVPGLGSLPLAGELFKLHSASSSKTELYIVVTPHVVQHGVPGPDVPPVTPAG